MEIFCFLLGILYLYTFNLYLPAATLLVFYITPRYPVIVLFFVGILVAWLHDQNTRLPNMPAENVIPNAVITGSIASIPVANNDKTQFHFKLETINNKPVKGLIQLAWYNHPPPLQAGQRWHLTVKLKKARNFLNPGSYNYVNALASRHISWTGYIRSRECHRLPEQKQLFQWLELRQKLASALFKLAPNEQTAGIIEALTLNLTTHISQEDWSLFRRTGTTHLFGISGEHIALVSGLMFFLLRRIWSQSVRCCLRFPAVSFASVGGMTLALLYAFLAGFAPPVQRALIGCFFYTLCCLGKQRFTPWQVWRYALFGVLCLEPHAVFMQGFYFSFLAVACLLITQQRWQLKGLKSKIALQLSCLIGLMPLTLFWFSYGSFNGFIANMFAIPLVGFFIVPLALITMLISSFSWAPLLMTPLSWLIALLFKGLTWTEHLAFININWSIESVGLVVALMGGLFLWVLIPIKPVKMFALIWLMLAFFPPKTQIKSGAVLVQILDVGQGLAVSIRTKNHVLLYDTGDQFYKGSDFGTMVILPFFTVNHVKKVDKIVISHPDKDHRGGLKSIEAALLVDELLVNDPGFYRRGINCHEYPPWNWDGVDFHFLPVNTTFNDKNNNSCILQISTGSASVLLVGDIEKLGEDYLVRTYGARLASDYLIVPHHGSKTSSSYRFLLEVAPRYAIASLGFDNRFHFPHSKTLANMHSLNIPFYRTDECGMVEMLLTAEGAAPKPICFSGLDLDTAKQNEV